MFTVNNNNNKTTFTDILLVSLLLIRNNFTPNSVSIVTFEQANAGWDRACFDLLKVSSVSLNKFQQIVLR